MRKDRRDLKLGIYEDGDEDEDEDSVILITVVIK